MCRDLWTGKKEWQLELSERALGPARSCDIDGDGRGEFLIGRHAIGVGTDGKPRIEWTHDAPTTGYAAIADVDGDGRAELIVPGGDGKVRVLDGE